MLTIHSPQVSVIHRLRLRFSSISEETAWRGVGFAVATLAFITGAALTGLLPLLFYLSRNICGAGLNLIRCVLWLVGVALLPVRWLWQTTIVQWIVAIVSFPFWLLASPLVYALSASNFAGTAIWVMLCGVAPTLPLSVWTAVRLVALAFGVRVAWRAVFHHKSQLFARLWEAVLTLGVLVWPCQVGFLTGLELFRGVAMRAYSAVYAAVTVWGTDASLLRRFHEVESPPSHKFVDEAAFAEAFKRRLVAPLDGVYSRVRSPVPAGGANVRRLMRELRDLSKSLPCASSSVICVRYDKARPHVMQALISGPPDCPLESGLFLFDITCADFPSVPPDVKIISTDGGRVRWNPNLYSSGKVCLSLLGTWPGLPSERWNTDSTLYQVLVSIQSQLVGAAMPAMNEPGVHLGRTLVLSSWRDMLLRGTNGGIEPLRENTLRVAILGMIEQSPVGFEDIVRQFFKPKRAYIADQCSRWVKSAQARGGKSSAHATKLEGLAQRVDAAIAALGE